MDINAPDILVGNNIRRKFILEFRHWLSITLFFRSNIITKSVSCGELHHPRLLCLRKNNRPYTTHDRADAVDFHPQYPTPLAGYNLFTLKLTDRGYSITPDFVGRAKIYK